MRWACFRRADGFAISGPGLIAQLQCSASSVRLSLRQVSPRTPIISNSPRPAVVFCPCRRRPGGRSHADGVLSDAGRLRAFLVFEWSLALHRFRDARVFRSRFAGVARRCARNRALLEPERDRRCIATSGARPDDRWRQHERGSARHSLTPIPVGGSLPVFLAFPNPSRWPRPWPADPRPPMVTNWWWVSPFVMLSLGKTVEGMKDYPVLAAPGIDLPSTPSALWCWLRGEDRGASDRALARAGTVAGAGLPADRRGGCVPTARTATCPATRTAPRTPRGDAALEAALVSGRGAGLDGGSFVAVSSGCMTSTGCRRSPARRWTTSSAAVSPTTKNWKTRRPTPRQAHRAGKLRARRVPPAARRSPGPDEHPAGLLFAAFGRSFEELRGRVATDDRRGRRGVDGLFRFTRPISGSYFWCVRPWPTWPPRSVRPRPPEGLRQQARPAAASCAALVGGSHGGLVDQRRYFLRSARPVTRGWHRG